MFIFEAKNITNLFYKFHRLTSLPRLASIALIVLKSIRRIKEQGTRMKIKLPLMAACILILSACSSPPPPPSIDNPTASMAEASYSVSRSIVSLSETAQAAHPLPKLDPPPNPASYGMAGLTSVDWSGPVEPLVRQIAKVTGYRVRVLGTPPAIPVIVTVYDKNMMIADILRDVGYQCGRRAAIVVYPESRVIELRYAKN